MRLFSTFVNRSKHIMIATAIEEPQLSFNGPLLIHSTAIEEPQLSFHGPLVIHSLVYGPFLILFVISAFQ